MRKMQTMVSRKTDSPAPLPGLRAESTTGTGRGELEGIQGPQASRAPAGKTGTRADGIAAALAPAIASAEGCRILVYGRTRWGKSAFARHLVTAVLDSRVAETVLIHDVKYPDHAQFTGEEATAITQIGEAMQRGSVVVLRPPVSAMEAAHVARILSEYREPTLLLVDETRRALGGSQIWCDGKNPDGSQGPKSFEWLCLEGGGLGASLVLLVQRPRQLPGDAVDSAQVHVVFGLGGRSLSYLVAAGTVPPEAAATVRALKPGAFCLFTDDEEWSGITYYSPE